MKTLIGFFDSPAQARAVIERLGTAADFVSPPTSTLISRSTATTETRDHLKSEAPTSPGQDGLPAATADLVEATAGRLQLPNTLDTVAPGDSTNQAATHSIADPGLNSLPGGLHGALSGWGFGADAIRACEDQVHAGRALLFVEIVRDTDTERVQNMLQRAGASQTLDSGHIRV